MDGIVSSRTAYRPISKKTKHGSEKSYDKQGKLQREIYYEESKKMVFSTITLAIVQFTFEGTIPRDY
jgi:hypothetical protein